LTPEDEKFFREFAATHGVHVWLQPGGPESAHPFAPEESDLYYTLPGLKIHFRPTDFTQVNAAVNRVLVAKAMQLLDPRRASASATSSAASATSACRSRSSAPR
jgi:23S rRNA (uracil1939-C5)-methyltransferase